LSLNEAGAIAYYTSDAATILDPNAQRNASPYFTLNKVLARRDKSGLLKWGPFLYFLLSGLAKLNNWKGTVYRAIDVPVLQNSNTQYKLSNTVVWVAFSSTSTNVKTMKKFCKDKKSGTWMILKVIEGKDVSDFSIYPLEQEVLLCPNATFKVENISTMNMKEVMDWNKNLDVIDMTQQPTPVTLMSRLSRQ